MDQTVPDGHNSVCGGKFPEIPGDRVQDTGYRKAKTNPSPRRAQRTENTKTAQCMVKFKVVVVPVVTLAVPLCVVKPLAVTVTVYVPTGTQSEL